MKKFALLALLFAPFLAQAEPSEQAAYDYRNTMQSVGEDLQNARPESAFAKVKPLAEQGYPEAQYILGTLYQDGEGVAQNNLEAQKWYQRAASQSNNKETAALANEALSELQNAAPSNDE